VDEEESRQVVDDRCDDFRKRFNAGVASESVGELPAIAQDFQDSSSNSLSQGDSEGTL
jgi:hypothetical protein